MGMTPDHFPGIEAGDILKIKLAGFLVQVSNKQDLKQDIPEFFAHIFRAFGLDGIHQFVHFFDQVNSQGSRGLFPVPGASVFSAQGFNQANQIGYVF